MYPLAAAATTVVTTAAAVASESGQASGLSINLFWVIVAALNFLVFLAIMWRFAFDPIANILAQRKARIEQGIKDAEQARRDREAGAVDRERVRTDARREASEVIVRAQQAAQQMRDADVAATREELQRLRERAAAEIAAERDAALADLRAQVADLALAAAGKVVGESMTGARQKRLVDEFVRDKGMPGEGRTN